MQYVRNGSGKNEVNLKLYVKNMVCDRCIMAVKAELIQLGFHPVSVQLGEVVIDEEAIDPKENELLKARLEKIGFEILEDKEKQTVEKIKAVIINLIHNHDNESSIKYSDYISDHIGREYHYLSKLFSDNEATTIEQYIIHQRIEKVKELLGYEELTLSEIAFKLGYSSVAALSSQFKKVLGITPTEYKKMINKSRITLDKVGLIQG